MQAFKIKGVYRFWQKLVINIRSYRFYTNNV